MEKDTAYLPIFAESKTPTSAASLDKNVKFHLNSRRNFVFEYWRHLEQYNNINEICDFH